MRARTSRNLIVSLGVAVAAAALAPAALGSHQQGGWFSGATISADGHLTGEITYMEQASGNCVLGQPSTVAPVLTFPDASTHTVNIPLTATNCLPSTAFYQGDFDVDLAAAGGSSATSGQYDITLTTCCMIGGISNLGGSGSTVYGARLNWDGATPVRGPVFASLPAPGIPIGFDYSQNLNATSPGGGPLAYGSLVGSADGPSSDIISIGASSGQITIPATTTSTLSQGDAFVFRVQATDAAGNHAQRMALLKATTNTPPVIDGLQDTYFVQPGQSASFPFSSSDTAGQTVSLLAFGAPSWVTLESTPGNPASGVLRVSPPAGLAAGSQAKVNIDAVDSDTFASLVTSRTVTFVAGAAPGEPAPPAPAPAPERVVESIVAPVLAPTKASRAAGETRIVHRLSLTAPGRYTFIFRNRATGKRIPQLGGSRLGPRTLRVTHSAPVLRATASRKIALVSLFDKRAKLRNLELRVVLKRPDGSLVEEFIR